MEEAEFRRMRWELRKVQENAVGAQKNMPASAQVGQTSSKNTPSLIKVFVIYLLPLAMTLALPEAAGAWGRSKLENQSGAAASFFFNLLTPAALISAGALNDAFIFITAQKAAQQDKAMTFQQFDEERLATAKWQRLTNAYCLLMVIAFGCELMTVFMGTIAGCRMLGSHYNPMADSVVSMLVREFEFEYVAVRVQFVSGILAYLVAQALRVYKELHKKEFLARGAAFFLIYCAVECLCFFNGHLYLYGGYPQLLARYLSLAGAGLLAKGGLLPLFGIMLLTAACVFMILSMIDADGDGNL